jgi:hypothetical protein
MTPFDIIQIRERHALHLDLLRCLDEIERLLAEAATTDRLRAALSTIANGVAGTLPNEEECRVIAREALCHEIQQRKETNP